MSDRVLTYDSKDMEFENLSRNPMTLVDFWATWCGPCRMMAPRIDQLAEEMPDVTVAKLNVDENPKPTMELGIQAIPTMILFKNGEEVERFVGLQELADLKAAIASHR